MVGPQSIESWPCPKQTDPRPHRASGKVCLCLWNRCFSILLAQVDPNPLFLAHALAQGKDRCYGFLYTTNDFPQFAYTFSIFFYTFLYFWATGGGMGVPQIRDAGSRLQMVWKPLILKQKVYFVKHWRVYTDCDIFVSKEFHLNKKQQQQSLATRSDEFVFNNHLSVMIISMNKKIGNKY